MWAEAASIFDARDEARDDTGSVAESLDGVAAAAVAAAHASGHTAGVPTSAAALAHAQTLAAAHAQALAAAQTWSAAHSVSTASGHLGPAAGHALGLPGSGLVYASSGSVASVAAGLPPMHAGMGLGAASNSPARNYVPQGLEWVERDGEMVLEVAPLPGRLVVLLSGAVEHAHHAVGPSSELASVTAWYQ